MYIILKMHNTVTTLAIIFSLIITIGIITPAHVFADTDTASEPEDLSGRVIFLDPGHDEETGNYIEDYSEHITMLILAEKIKPRLEELGATVYLTRDSEKRKSSEVRCAFINQCALKAIKEARLHDAEADDDDAADVGEIDRLIAVLQTIIDEPKLGEVYMNSPYDPERTIHPDQARVLKLEDDDEILSRFLFVSLHSNASSYGGNSGDSGACAFYISTTDKIVKNYYENIPYSSYSEISRDFGNIILDHIAGTGLINLGSMADNFFMIREHNIPGVLVENGYHTNPGDRAMLQSDEFLETLAEAYADAIVEYFRDILLPERFSEPEEILVEEPEEEEQVEETDDSDAVAEEETYEIKRVFLYIS